MSDPRASVPSVEAVAWTAIGVLAAAVLGFFVTLFVSARLDARIDALTARMDDHLRRHAG